jgi:hypothetical protein
LLRQGKLRQALEDKSKFQLAAITAFYTAVKIHEPVMLEINMLLVVCRHAYTEDDFVSMEMDILSTINWRVSCHTAIDYARTLLELIHENKHLPSSIANDLLGDCKNQMGDVIAGIRFLCCKQSELSIYCVAFSLAKNKWLSLLEKQAIWVRLLESCDVDLSLMRGATSQQNLARASLFKPNTVSKLVISSQQHPSAEFSKYSTAGSSSLVCISCTAP